MSAFRYILHTAAPTTCLRAETSGLPVRFKRTRKDVLVRKESPASSSHRLSMKLTVWLSVSSRQLRGGRAYRRRYSFCGTVLLRKWYS